MASLVPNGKQYYESSAGVPLVGGKVFTYDAGTTNPRPTYSDAAGTVPNTNPVILDARGEALIFWAGTYKIVLQDALGNVIWTVDNVNDGTSAAAAVQTNLTNFINALAAPGGALTVGYSGITVDAALKGMIRDVRTFTGIVADGVTDDFAALQAAFITAKATGSGIFWPENVKTFVQFSVANPHMFISGAVAIVGANRFNSGIIFHCNYDMGAVHAPLFCWGITAVGSAVDKVIGDVHNLGWWLKAGSLKFERLNHVYGATNFTIDHCYCDMTSVTWAVNQQAGGWWSSNVQPTFAIAQTQDTNVTLSNNIGLAKAEYQNAESFGFSNTNGLHYLNNWLVGWADDMAAHQCVDVGMHFNHIETVSGRYYAENSQRVRICNNEISPLVRPVAGVYLGPTRAYIQINMQTQYAATLVDAPNNDVLIHGNSIYVPSTAYSASAITCYGVQDGLTIVNNNIYNDGATSPATAIFVSTLFRAGWTGPAGNPDFAAGGAIKLRSTTIANNKTLGGGWAATEGDMSIVVYAGGTATDVIGPVSMKDNTAGKYNVTNEAVTFGQNFANSLATDPFLGLSLVALWNSLTSAATQWFGMLPNSANINNTNFPQGTPTFYTPLDSDGMKFIAMRQGRIIGAYMQTTAALTAANNVVLRLLKNGVQVGADTDSSSNAPTTNPARYLWNFTSVAGLSFAEGDKIETPVTIRVAQGATNVVGRIVLVVIYQ